LSLSTANTNFANLSAQAGLYQGTAAVASWLSGLAASNSTQGSPPSASTASVVPNVSSGLGTTAYTQFQSRVSAATTAAPSASSQTDDAGASNYQQAVAAYGDN
jgi:hypothetical protein